MEREDRRTSQRRTGSQDSARDERTGRGAAAARMQHQTQWVDLQVREAAQRGDFDDLPGLGKPIRDLGAEHDPDWWVKRLVEREQLHLVPPSLALRTEDAELDRELDRCSSPAQVARAVEEFNARVREVLYSNPGGPPVLTQQRDPDHEVQQWKERRVARRKASTSAPDPAASEEPEPGSRDPVRRWWRRRGR